MRPYNKDIDTYYSPDDTPDLYLTEEQVNNTLEMLSEINEPSEIAVRDVIKRIETINREEKLGIISTKDSFSKIRTISDDFLDKYGFWPYITKTFENFYESFITNC